MKTTLKNRFKLYTQWLQVVLVAIALSACSRPSCSTGAPPVTGLVGQPFRLFTTTNSSVILNNFNSMILTFNNDFTGKLQRLSNNRLYESATIVWNINTDQKLLRIQYTPVSGDPNGGGTTTGGGESQTVTYSIIISSKGIDMTETDTGRGFNYFWGPYTGAVNAGTLSKCTFTK